MEAGNEITDRRRSCVVLVTGASGFLGQHVIGLLQTRADHVTNIRVLDIVEYVNKLDYDAPKPVEQYIGSINDLDLVTRACKDVDCVMHVASLIDTRMFPNRKLLEQINIGGTTTVIQGCRKQGVKQLIYCSTMDVVIGYDDIISGTEETARKPTKFALKDYAETKCKAEEMILEANDYDAPKPVEQYIGSINDLDLLTRACKDVDCVMHMASLIDSRMFPNRKLLEQVNVGGTATVIKACRKQGVKRIIYCSTTYVVIGYDEIIHGTEETTRKPSKFALEDYAETKCMAIEMVLKANDPHLTTLAIRPSSIYGELDRLCVTQPLQIAKQIGCYLQFNTDAVYQLSYAGNVAWAFICAEQNFFESSIKKLHMENKSGGNAFFACDETPVTSFTEFTKSFLDSLGMKSFFFKIPIDLSIFVMYMMFYFMIVIRLVLDVNCLIGPGFLKALNTNFSFIDDKAKNFLGYKPIYTFAEAHERSIIYYKKLADAP